MFQTPSSKRIELTVFTSNHHVEMNPSDVGIYDRVVIQEIIKEVAQTQQLDRTKHAFKGMPLQTKAIYVRSFSNDDSISGRYFGGRPDE